MAALVIFGAMTVGMVRASWANPRPLSLGNLLTWVSLIMGTGLLLGAYIGNPDPVCNGKTMASTAEPVSKDVLEKVLLKPQ